MSDPHPAIRKDIAFGASMSQTLSSLVLAVSGIARYDSHSVADAGHCG